MDTPILSSRCSGLTSVAIGQYTSTCSVWLPVVNIVINMHFRGQSHSSRKKNLIFLEMAYVVSKEATCPAKYYLKLYMLHQIMFINNYYCRYSVALYSTQYNLYLEYTS